MERLIRQVLKEETENIDYVWYFYDKFLNRQPIEFEGLFLEPSYNKKNDIIIWDVANPNDYSFNFNILHFYLFLLCVRPKIISWTFQVVQGWGVCSLYTMFR